MRRGELLNLTWDNVNLEQGIICVIESKSGKPREIPIQDKLADVLISLGIRAGKVFDIPVIAIRRYFEQTLEESKINNFRFTI